MSRIRPISPAVLVIGALFLIACLPLGQASATPGPDIIENAEHFGISPADAEARAYWEEELLEAAMAAQADKRHFGGAYFGELNGEWGLVIQFVGSNAGRARVEEVVPTGAPVAWVRVRYSQAELVQVQSAIASQLVDLGLSYVELDTINNRVVVAVRTGDPSIVAEKLAGFGDAVYVLPDNVDVSGTACTDRDNCTPWRAGIYVYKAGTPADHDLPGANGCTWGWTGRYNGTGGLVMVTAGHCYTSVSWYHSTDPWRYIGTTSYNALNPTFGQPTDVARVATSSTHISSHPKNRLYRNDSNKNYALTSMRPADQIAVGQSIRKTGVTSGTTTGSIVSLGVFYTISNNPYDPGTVLWGMRHDASVSAGDSGGPVWGATSLKLYGLHSAGLGIFVPATMAQDNLAVTFCFTDSCPWP